MEQENKITVDFYLKDSNGDECRMTKTIDCSYVDHDNMEGLFNEFKNFLKTMDYSEEFIDGRLQYIDWQRIDNERAEKWLENGETVLISRGGECESYVYNGTFPNDTEFWCFLPRGFSI